VKVVIGRYPSVSYVFVTSYGLSSPFQPFPATGLWIDAPIFTNACVLETPRCVNRNTLAQGPFSQIPRSQNTLGMAVALLLFSCPALQLNVAEDLSAFMQCAKK